MLFTKCLTQTDLNSKLTVSVDFFGKFFHFYDGGGGAVDLLFRNQNGLIWPFRMSIIRTGSDRYKLFLSAGWLSFVRDRKLQCGDLLSIYEEESNKRMYRIEVKRRKGSDSNEWIRLV